MVFEAFRIRTAHASALLCSLFIAACGPAELTPQELCEEAATLVGEDLVVSGRPTPGAVTLLSTTLILCAPGTCCNWIWYAPAFVCGDGTTIYVAPARWDGFDDISLSYVCVSPPEIRPTASCSIDPACESKFGQITSLRGRLTRRALLLGGTDQRLVLEVAASTSAWINDAGRPSD